jgi:hypothetical protein
LLTRVLVIGCAALGIGQQQIRPSGHQLLLLRAGLGPLDDRFGVEAPALPALSHPQPPRLIRTRQTLIMPRRAARDGRAEVVIRRRHLFDKDTDRPEEIGASYLPVELVRQPQSVISTGVS